MGPSLPKDNCIHVPSLQLHQEAGRLQLPFPAAFVLPGENQVSPLGKTELAARGRRPFGCGKETCPASPGRLPRASDLLPGPSQDSSGIHTNQGGGRELGSLQAPTPPVLSFPARPSASPLPPPTVPVLLQFSDGMKGQGQRQAEPFLSYSSPKHILALWKRE